MIYNIVLLEKSTFSPAVADYWRNVLNGGA
jgi:hypothetical protein